MKLIALWTETRDEQGPGWVHQFSAARQDVPARCHKILSQLFNDSIWHFSQAFSR